MASAPSGDATVVGSYVWAKWVSFTAAVGNGGDQVFIQNNKNVTYNYTIPTGTNAMSTGAITINSGITVTIPSGSRWAII